MGAKTRVSRRSWLGFLLASVSLTGLVGCGSKTYPVKGIVVFDDDRPATELAGGFVTFEPTDQNVSAHGSIGQDATFTLTTYQQGDGACAGVYRVVVTPRPYSGSEFGPARTPPLNPRYSDVKTSGLTLTVEPKKNDVTIKLQRRR